MVIHNQEAIIDHVFAAAKPPITPNPSGGGTQGGGNAGAVTQGGGTGGGRNDPAAPTPASPPSKGVIDFTVGPLTISGVSLQYKEQGNDKLISITMDATFAMAPVTFSLLGFGFGVPLGDVKLDNLSPLFGHIHPLIAGLSLSFDKPPLLVAGGFEHQIIGSGVDLQDIYLGGIGISWPPYTFVGLGEYAVLNGFKSVFLYAKLDGRKYLLTHMICKADQYSTGHPRICDHLWRPHGIWIQLLRPVADGGSNYRLSIHQRPFDKRCWQ